MDKKVINDKLEQYYQEDIVDKKITYARTAYFLGYCRAQIEFKREEINKLEEELTKLRRVNVYSDEELDTAPIGGFHDY